MVKENTRKVGKRVQRSGKVLPKKKPFSRKGVKYGDRSGVWFHFNKVTDDNGNVEKVVCIYCRKEYGPKPGGNLVKHLSSCQDYMSWLLEEASSEEEASTLPSQKIRDEQPSSSNPSRRDGSNGGAVGKMCNDYKKKATGNISEQIMAAAGWASLSVGTVRIMAAGEVLYTSCNFIDGDEWKLHRVIIGARVAVPLAPDYTGPSLLGLAKPKELASLDDKVLNYAVLRDISEHASWLVGVFMPQGITKNIHNLYATPEEKDISHISIKDLMQQQKEEAEGPQNLICSTYVDDVLHSVAQCLVPEESSPIIQQMRTNMKTLERFTQNNCHQQAALPYPGLDYPRSYDKQWYSLYCSLKILSGDNNDDSTLKVWGQIDQSIKEISKPSCPTSHLCLVELFNVRKVLQSELERAASSNNNDAAGAALTKARDALDKAIEESYLVWSIALVLDPRHRIRGLRTIFKEAYGKDEAESRRSKVESKIRELCHRVAECPCYRDPVKSSLQYMEKVILTTCSYEKRLTIYLQGDPVKEGKYFDILEWWKKDMKGQDCKTCLTKGFLGRLARDFLGMPTCSLLSSEQISQVRSIIHQQEEEAAVAAGEEEEVVGRKSESCSRTEK